MQKNYMMNANDVADELGVSKGHAYKCGADESRSRDYGRIKGKRPDEVGRIDE